MSFSYVARQEILDTEKNTVAYELLFRDGPNNAFPEIDAEIATHQLLSDQFFTSPFNALGNKPGYINFPYQSLINKIPTLFPKEHIVIEVLEDCPPTDELFAALQLLVEQGYTIALDDFIPSPQWRRFLPLVTTIKFDIRAIAIEKAAFFIKKSRASGQNIQFLAEKVETYQEFQAALNAGFTLFQGYFFSKPEMLKQKSIRSGALSVIKLCKVLSYDEIDYSEVDQIISLDVTLSYKLLRYVNSSGVLKSEINSFHQALVYLGQEKLRKFISLAAISSVAQDKPDPLFSLSIQRARFAELMAQHTGKNQSSAFLTGIFSLLDSLLDQPLTSIIKVIPIDKEIQEALLFKKGELGEILALVIAYQQADWSEVSRLQQLVGIDIESLNKSYQASLLWTDELFKSSNNSKGINKVR